MNTYIQLYPIDSNCIDVKSHAAPQKAQHFSPVASKIAVAPSSNFRIRPWHPMNEPLHIGHFPSVGSRGHRGPLGTPPTWS